MTEFKIGDRVKILLDKAKEDSKYGNHTGEEGNIFDIEYLHKYKVKLDSGRIIPINTAIDFGDIIELIESPQVNIINPSGNTRDGMSAFQIRLAEILLRRLSESHGGVTMELKDLKQKNILEAKKQFEEEKKNSEIEFAKQELRVYRDKRDALDRDINKLEKEKLELDAKYIVFRNC